MKFVLPSRLTKLGNEKVKTVTANDLNPLL